ncbi:class I SAM-dependent methyltransferase [Demequina aurantiaca]|uniref:class I SAM-dependent methyltransferase n=1 Tax=Demequina aurantiaca TaxID=676200 RepID=UPI003D32E48D
MRGTYERGALLYDWVSGERTVYRSGRVAGVELLDLSAGDTVLDIGCGTGLNFPQLVEAVGPTGRVIGLDRSPGMLARADHRVARRGWTNVTTVRADATEFTSETIGADAVDAVFATYSLSVVDDWRSAWENSLAVLRPGGRAGIVDMRIPTTATPLLSPLARLACAIGGADIEAHPWTALSEEGRDVRDVTLRAGHIVAAAATVH